MIKKIVDFIQTHHPSYSEIMDCFSHENIDIIKETILKLEQTGQIEKIKDKYYLSKELNLIPATIASIKDKFSFATINDEQDVYIDNDDLKNAFVGDCVLLKKISTKYDRREQFEVVKVVKRNRDIIVGEVKIRAGIKTLSVEKIANPSITFLIQEKSIIVNNNQIIRAAVKKISNRICVVEPIEIIGDKNDIGVDVSKIILSNNAPLVFPEEVKKEVICIPSMVNNEERQSRVDFTDHLIVTIDGDDAKDFDDAVEVSLVEDIYYVGVHIADVAHYVKEGSAIDKEALNRSTSLYVQDRVVPMLPFELSNGICSLNPKELRLVTSCLFSIDRSGKILTKQICKGVIASKHRLTYNYVNNFLNNERLKKESYSELEQMLINLKDAADIIRKTRQKNGGLELLSTELSFKLNDKGYPYEVSKRKQDVGERLIEDLMIKANEIVSETIEKLDLPMIYRIHDKPRAKRIEQFKLLSEFKGYPCNFDSLNCSPKDISKYLDSITDTSDKTILSGLLLRCLAKAKYSPQNKKHFGLASNSYTHFTSPIRRYPDLIVHRLIDKYIIDNNRIAIDEDKAKIASICEITSDHERRALTIERSVDDLLCAKYMADKLGNEYFGIIVSMTQQGMFIELENGIQGYIPFESIAGDYYIFDEETYRATGIRKGKTFVLGQSVQVVVCNVDIDHSQITFNLISQAKKKNSKEMHKKNGRKNKSYRHK